MASEPIEIKSGHKGTPGMRSTNPSSALYGETKSDSAARKDNVPVAGSGSAASAAELERTLNEGMRRDRR